MFVPISLGKFDKHNIVKKYKNKESDDIIKIYEYEVDRVKDYQLNLNQEELFEAKNFLVDLIGRIDNLTSRINQINDLSLLNQLVEYNILFDGFINLVESMEVKE